MRGFLVAGKRARTLDLSETGWQGGSLLPPPLFGQFGFNWGNRPESTQICPNSVKISKISSNSDPDTPFDTLIQIFDKKLRSYAACEKSMRAKNRTILAIWVAIWAIWMVCPPFWKFLRAPMLVKGGEGGGGAVQKYANRCQIFWTATVLRYWKMQTFNQGRIQLFGAGGVGGTPKKGHFSTFTMSNLFSFAKTV